MGKSSLICPHFLVGFPNFSSNFLNFLSLFRLSGGQFAHPGRTWLCPPLVNFLICRSAKNVPQNAQDRNERTYKTLVKNKMNVSQPNENRRRLQFNNLSFLEVKFLNLEDNGERNEEPQKYNTNVNENTSLSKTKYGISPLEKSIIKDFDKRQKCMKN